uniref:Protein kinase domain-containing protein n=1 Tax=Rhabditophanes sp. KR3021 TaxID=114890 RepID=A0AC35UAV3_9BILA
MALPTLAKKVKALASQQLINFKSLLNGRSFAKFKKNYILQKEAGRGGFGILYAAIRISDEAPVAVKFVERRHIRDWGKLNEERVPLEICMLAKCSKIEGVIKLLDWYSLPEGYLIVMERPTPCMDLFDFIKQQHHLDEDISKFLFKQIVTTIFDLADRKILHRDIKDENIVIDLISGETRLVDFGAATLLKKSRYSDFQGTKLYCPPEWFLKSIYMGKEAAVWSLGVLLYNMLNGRLPFRNEKDICTSHMLGPLPYYNSLSEEVRDLIEKCLRFDMQSRASIEDILRHPWLEGAENQDWITFATVMTINCHSSNGEDSGNENEHDDESTSSGTINNHIIIQKPICPILKNAPKLIGKDVSGDESGMESYESNTSQNQSNIIKNKTHEGKVQESENNTKGEVRVPLYAARNVKTTVMNSGVVKKKVEHMLPKKPVSKFKLSVDSGKFKQKTKIYCKTQIDKTFEDV